MRITYLAVAVLLASGAIVATVFAQSQQSATGAIADANGNLHVPDAYHTTFQSLGSWR